MRRAMILAGVIVFAAPAGPRARESGPQLTRRQEEIVRGITRYAPWDCPNRWLYELGDVETRNGILRDAMMDQVSWVDFLALANALDWGRREAGRTHEFLMERLTRIPSGKVRQNIIFLVALTAGDATGHLEAVFHRRRQGLSDEDRADAACALAALGDEEAADWLIREFPTTDAFLGRPVFEFADYRKEEADEKNREVVRSYRFWEMIFRRPYFMRLELLARSGIYRMTAHEGSAAERDARAARLLPVFISKWHGHPGSDDIAMRMLNYAIQKRDRTSIYTWAQRASLLPDQDCAPGAVHILTALADSQLSAADLVEILRSEDGKRNREFLLYERFIKTARRDLDAGLALFDEFAAGDPTSVFALARRMAARVGPSKALRDGILEPLTLKIMLGYPKRSKVLGETPHEARKEVREEEYVGLLTDRERVVVLRTRLDRSSSVTIDPSALAHQVRLLLELRNLIEMEQREESPAVKADLRYRQAKLFYHESRVFFPVWGREILNFGYRLNTVRYDESADERLEGYVGETFALRRAYAVLDSIRKEFPGYEGMDLVLFHMGHCYARLMDYRPGKAVDVWTFPDKPPPGSREAVVEYGHRRVGEIFQELLERCPESEWAQKVESAATWRLKMARILRAKREKEEASQPRKMRF